MKKVFIVLIILLLTLVAALYFWLNRITNKIFIPNVKTNPALINTIQQSFDDKKPIDILLLGYRGGNGEGAYLTDSIIAVRIDPKTRKVFLISIPRDIWIKIATDDADGGYAKINAAYQIGLGDKGPGGGAKMAEYVVSQVTGFTIDYFVGVDFSGFTRTIDTLGGVDIGVEKTFDDYQYPIEGKEDDACGLADTEIASLSAQLASQSAEIEEFEAFPCRFEHLHFDSGEQHMDGITALKYVRSRHSLQDGTDFGRAQRQRNLLVAVKEKIFSAGFIPQVIPFMTSLGDNLRTDLTLDDVRVFLQNISALNNYQIVSPSITDQDYLQDAVSSDGQAILVPKDGTDNWTSVHNWLKDEFSGKPRSVAVVVQVENGTPIAGLAGIATDRLRDAGMQLLNPVNASSRNSQTTTITVYDKNVERTDIDKLKKEFGVTSVNYATTIQTDYNVLVEVGNDYKIKGQRVAK